MAVAVAVALMGGGTSGTGVQAQASAVCTDAQRALEQLPQSPSSVAEGFDIERRMLAIKKQELSQLQALAPRGNDSFRAGLADDKALLAGLSSMMARPDFVRLSLTLPGHPNLVPSWLKKWLVREQALLADVKDRFSHAGIPACEKTFG